MLRRKAYFPFGSGLRMCTGMNLGRKEVLLAAARLLQRFEVCKVSPSSAPPTLDVEYGHTLQPQPVSMRFRAR